MAIDYLTTDTELTSVADAIRTKGGTSAALTYPAGFVSAIEAIPTGGGTYQAKTNITPTTSSQTITPDTGYDALSSVQINAMPSGSATTPATTITANPSISVNSSGLITATNSKTQSVTPTVSAGYVSSGTAGTITVNGSNTSQLTTQAAQTIHPSSSDQSIASSKYLTGAQTIKGVVCTNLTAGNIKNGVTVKIGDSTDDDCVTSVTGTYSGGGGGNIKRIAGSGNTTVYPTGWSSADFGSVSVPGESDVISANDPKFLIAHVTIGGVVRSFAAGRMDSNYIRFSGGYTTNNYGNSLSVPITSTEGYINSITFPATVSNKAIGAWEIISNLPVREEPQGGTFFVDVDGDQTECTFGVDTQTWNEWVQSEYNEIMLEEMEGYVVDQNMRILAYDEYGEEYVGIDDEITNGTTYYLI